MDTHTGKVLTKCTICGKGCASEHDDKEHLDLKHGDLNIVCTSCNPTFLNKHTLKIHQETEHKKKSWGKC